MISHSWQVCESIGNNTININEDNNYSNIQFFNTFAQWQRESQNPFMYIDYAHNSTLLFHIIKTGIIVNLF